MRYLRAVLEEGGRAIILVPAGPGLYGTLDTVLGYERRETVEKLMELVEKSGCELENLLSFNPTGVTAWWLNGRVLKRKTFGLWQITMLNLLPPIFRRVDRWLPLPPLSLIALARQPAIDPAENWRQQVQHLDLPQTEGLSLEHLAIQPPRGNSGAIETQEVFEFKAAFLDKFHHFLSRVAPLMYLICIERAVQTMS